MRLEELKTLTAALVAGTSADDVDRAFRQALDVQTPKLDSLVAHLLSQLRPPPSVLTNSYLDERRRVLIADHAFTSAGAASGNLAHAVLHLWAALEQWELSNEKNSRTLRTDGEVDLPAPTTVGAFLPEWLEQQHVAGLFGSISSALDCLAATAVVVMGIPLNVVKTDLGKLRRWFAETKHASEQQTQFGRSLERAVEDEGPPDWLSWALDYRHTFVHRARRTEHRRTESESRIYDARGQPIVRTNQTVLLLRDPALSNLEAVVQFLRTGGLMMLNEPAEHTLRELIQSTRRLIERIADLLLNASEPDAGDVASRSQLLARQWPEVRLKPARKFEGYSPRRVPTKSGDFNFVVAPVDAARLEAGIGNTALWGGANDRPETTK